MTVDLSDDEGGAGRWVAHAVTQVKVIVYLLYSCIAVMSMAVEEQTAGPS